ncbi:MAG: MarR family transcriptional regulator [Spirochaetes bacterium]|nr:MarR family transcriptional regulator [Spirochaetota bacterium]MBX3721650.1 MarR family transcriptional regulator [Turneriella sp.]
MQARRNILNLMSKVRSRAFLFLEKELAAAGVADLSPAHGDVLFAAARNPGSDMRQLAALTGRDKSTLTPLVERLVRDGYLLRQSSAADRRRAEISLTPKSEKLRPRLIKIGMKLERRMLDGVAEGDRKTVIEALQRMHTNLGG